MAPLPSPEDVDMFHVFLRSIDGELVAQVALAPDDFCHVLFLEVTHLFECDVATFSLYVGTRPLQHDDMISEQLTASCCDVTVLWHSTIRGTHAQETVDSSAPSND